MDTLHIVACVLLILALSVIVAYRMYRMKQRRCKKCGCNPERIFQLWPLGGKASHLDPLLDGIKCLSLVFVRCRTEKFPAPDEGWVLVMHQQKYVLPWSYFFKRIFHRASLSPDVQILRKATGEGVEEVREILGIVQPPFVSTSPVHDGLGGLTIGRYIKGKDKSPEAFRKPPLNKPPVTEVSVHQ